MKRLWLVVLLANAFAAEPPPADTARLTATIDGITCNYAPADEALVRALAPLVAAQNREAVARVAPIGAAEAAVPPLSIADFRRNRADYLAHIAAAIGLEKPTAMQQECYDGYLDNFERTDRAFAIMLERLRTQLQIQDLTVVHKTDLLRRLKAGEKIPGLSLEPDGEHGHAEWTLPQANFHDERIAELLKQREQGRLDLGYNLSTSDGVVNFSAETRIKRSAAPASAKPVPAASEGEAAAASFPFPIIIQPDDESRPPGDLAAKFAKELDGILGDLRHVRPEQFQNPAALANLILHETTEIGIVERYIGSRDRRWLCEGVANYTAWKIARDCAGEAAARQIYDVQAQVAQSAALREKVDLRKWPAAENQRPEDANTPLTKAHYAYAAKAVFLIAGRHGDDFLPKLFREIGQTPRKKTDIRTVEKAYRKLAGEDLSLVLGAAMAPAVTASGGKGTP